MASVSFHGNVGKVQPAQFSNDGKARIRFSVAESHGRFDRTTNQWQDTGKTWRDVTVFGKRAETLADTLREGAKQQVVVIGREETREYDRQDGTKGSALEVVADVVGIIPSSQPAQQGPAMDPWKAAPANDPWAAPDSAPF